MKKVLMLVAMVVMTLAAMAQSNPKVSYQSVVRDENNRLVANQEVTVKVEVLDANDAVLYTETQTVTSNANGLVSLMIGGTDEFTTLDWANAQFATTVTVGNYQVMDTVPVTAVPFALNAMNGAGNITWSHQDMVDTIQHFIGDLSVAETETLLSELRDNTEVKDFMRDTVVNYAIKYIKNHPDKVIEVMKAFLSGVTRDQALQILDAIQGMDNGIKTGIKQWVAQVAKNNPDYALDILKSYLENVTMDQAQEVLAAIQSMPTAVKTGVKTWVAQVVKNNPDIAFDVLDYYLQNSNGDRVREAYTALQSNTTGAKDTIRKILVDYAKANKQIAIDILNAYASTVTLQEANQVLTIMQGLPADIKAAVKAYMVQFACNNREMAKEIAVNYLTNGTAEDVDALWNALMANNNGGKARVKYYIDLYLNHYLTTNGYCQGNCGGTNPGGD